MNSKRPDIYQLFEIMAALRADDGCPWDRKQTHDSLKTFLIEETYEVLDAIESGNPDDLREELGDLLLQIVFHAQLAREAKTFTLSDVIETIVEKMIRRHPHVFGDETITTAEEVSDRWQSIKRAEGRSVFGGLPKHLPALTRAQRVGAKASEFGFDWTETLPVLEKIEEELSELRQACQTCPEEAAGELGDLLFSAVNLARHLHVDAEDTLRQATKKFETRFQTVLELAKQDGVELETCDLEKLDRLWEQAKRCPDSE